MFIEWLNLNKAGLVTRTRSGVPRRLTRPWGSKLLAEGLGRFAGCSLWRGFRLFGFFLRGAPLQRFGHDVTHLGDGSRLARPNPKLAGRSEGDTSELQSLRQLV